MKKQLRIDKELTYRGGEGTEALDYQSLRRKQKCAQQENGCALALLFNYK